MQAKKVLAVQDPVGSHDVLAPMVLPHASPYEEAPVAAQTRPMRLCIVVHTGTVGTAVCGEVGSGSMIFVVDK